MHDTEMFLRSAGVAAFPGDDGLVVFRRFERRPFDDMDEPVCAARSRYRGLRYWGLGSGPSVGRDREPALRRSSRAPEAEGVCVYADLSWRKPQTRIVQ